MAINYEQREKTEVTLVPISATCDRCSSNIPIVYDRNPEDASQISAEGWYAGFYDNFDGDRSSLLCKSCCETLWEFMGWER